MKIHSTVLLSLGTVCVSFLDLAIPTEAVEYTNWYNKDAQGGFGDFEERSEHLRLFGLCDGNIPVGIECQTLSGIDWTLTGDVVEYCEPELGLVCLNANQVDGTGCENYRVRYSCPCPSSPTPTPTGNPTFGPCLDTPDQFQIDLSCKELAAKPTSEVETVCNLPWLGIADMCPELCDACPCPDSEFNFEFRYGGKDITCRDIAESSFKKKKKKCGSRKISKKCPCSCKNALP